MEEEELKQRKEYRERTGKRNPRPMRATELTSDLTSPHRHHRQSTNSVNDSSLISFVSFSEIPPTKDIVNILNESIENETVTRHVPLPSNVPFPSFFRSQVGSRLETGAGLADSVTSPRLREMPLPKDSDGNLAVEETMPSASSSSRQQPSVPAENTETTANATASSAAVGPGAVSYTHLTLPTMMSV